MNVVGLFARDHGYNGLETLIKSKKYNPIFIFTHKQNPKSLDPHKSIRDDYYQYEELCNKHKIPLFTVDSNHESDSMSYIMNILDIDFIASISWRRLVKLKDLKKPKYTAINLHRGALPIYSGAEPVVRALNNNEKEIYITGHVMTEEIDSGEILGTYKHNVKPGDTVENVKSELTPYFGPLLIECMDKYNE